MKHTNKPWDEIRTSIENIPNLSPTNYTSKLDKAQLDAKLLEDLYFSVVNGGFAQWVDNGYCVHFLLTLDVLNRIGTEHATKVFDLLKQLEPQLNITNKPQLSYWKSKDDKPFITFISDEESSFVEQETSSPGYDLADQLDQQFYTFYKEFELDIARWFNNGRPDNSKPKEPGAITPLHTEVRYPDINVKLVGQDGNAFVLLGLVKQALRRNRVPTEDQDLFIKEATSGDYDHLLRVCMSWVNVY